MRNSSDYGVFVVDDEVVNLLEIAYVRFFCRYQGDWNNLCVSHSHKYILNDEGKYEQLKAMIKTNGGVCTSWFTKDTSETSDSERLKRCSRFAMYGETMYFNEEKYIINETLYLGYGQNLLLSENSRIEASNDFSSIWTDEYLIYIGRWNMVKEWTTVDTFNIQSPYYECAGISPRLFPNNTLMYREKGFIKGGIIDGKGLANGIKVDGLYGYNISDITIYKPKKYGIWCGGGHELFMSNITICNQWGNTDVTAIYFKVTDSQIHDIIAINTLIGFHIKGSSSRCSRLHHWSLNSSDKDYISNSISFLLEASDTSLSDCYADTSEINYWIKPNFDATLINCGSFFNNSMATADKVVRIKNDGTAYIIGGRYFAYTKTGENVQIETSETTVKTEKVLVRGLD